MLFYFFVLIAFQLMGETLVFLTDLPIPGPVIGMALLLTFLIIKGNLPEEMDKTASGLLRYLALLFVPAGTGVTLHFSLITAEWLPITASLIVATLITIAFTALLMNWLDKSEKVLDNG